MELPVLRVWVSQVLPVEPVALVVLVHQVPQGSLGRQELQDYLGAQEGRGELAARGLPAS